MVSIRFRSSCIGTRPEAGGLDIIVRKGWIVDVVVGFFMQSRELRAAGVQGTNTILSLNHRLLSSTPPTPSRQDLGSSIPSSESVRQIRLITNQ